MLDLLRDTLVTVTVLGAAVTFALMSLAGRSH